MNEKIERYPETTRETWINAITDPPIENTGPFLVVVEGHGKKRMVVDFYDTDDYQWNEEYKDGDVVVTHYRALPEMPGK